MNVVDLFNETWKIKPKPYMYNRYIQKEKKNNLQECAGLEEFRSSDIQVTVYADKDGNLRCNTRMINKFPEFIAKLNSNVSCPRSELIFFNHTFLLGLLR